MYWNWVSNRGKGQRKRENEKDRENESMEEGNKAKEGNVKLLRKKEPTKPGRNILDRDPETKIWSLPRVQNRAIVWETGWLF